MNSNITNEYPSKDLYLAALFYAKGVKLINLYREGKTCWFIFQDKQTCENLQHQFFTKTAEVNAKEYADSLRTLKNLVFSEPTI